MPEGEQPYVVRLTHSEEYQDWPDTFGGFSSYEAAQEFVAAQSERAEVTGHAIDLLLEPSA